MRAIFIACLFLLASCVKNEFYLDFNLSDEDIEVAADAFKLPTFYAMFGVGIPLLFILLVILLIYSRKRKPKRSYDEILNDIKKS